MAIFHVLNRGVDKRDVFTNDRDRIRFIHDLFEFNDIEPSNYTFYIFNKRAQEIGWSPRKKRKRLVDIFTFTLMPNHYHLTISPIVENGLPLFLQKLNAGYTKYFNIRYERQGPLFSGTKKILIKDEAHFIHLPYYHHCNPLDLYMPEWRKRNLGNYKKALKFLENYRWSSHLDYLGKKNFPSVTQRNFLLKFFGGINGYRNSLEEWLRDFDSEIVTDVTLE